jgi:1,4-dihydroxy-2-naphthoyl-CoA synthase
MAADQRGAPAPQELTDVRYEQQDGLAWITIDRPERLNAFTAHTVDELIRCFKRAWAAPGLTAEVRRYAEEILALSPTALRFLKQSFNLETEHLAGQAALAFSGLEEFADSQEAQEGMRAFNQKRAPDFAPFRGGVSGSK